MSTVKKNVEGPTAKDLEVDVLVVGAGTGMVAALAAREKGLSVLIVEKTPLVGGSTAKSGGAVWIPGSVAIARGKGETSRQSAASYLKALVGNDSPKARYEAYLEQGPAAMDMLERMTKLRFNWIKGYADYQQGQPGSSALGYSCESKPFDKNRLGEDLGRFRSSDLGTAVPMAVTAADYRWFNLMLKRPLIAGPKILKRLVQGIGGRLLGKNYVALGEAFAAGLFDGVRRAGIPLWTRTKVVELIMEGERVAGAIIEQDNVRHRITARRGVILATGGFDHNLPMRQKYQSASLTADYSLGAEGNVGDGIHLGRAAGADLRLMEESWWYPAGASVERFPTVLLAERFLPGSLIVNDKGERFLDEALSYMSFGQVCLRHEKEGNPVGQMWFIFDQTHRNSYLFAGGILPYAPLPQAWYDAGILVKANGPVELARAMGLPEDKFVATLEKYNADCKAGKDSQFNRGENANDNYYGDPTIKPNPNLRPLSGVVYAMKLVLSDLGTCGGLAADEHARVQRPDSQTIPGLYAIGNTAGNAFGRTYPGAGATIGQGMTFGYIAAQHIAHEAEVDGKH